MSEAGVEEENTALYVIMQIIFPYWVMSLVHFIYL